MASSLWDLARLAAHEPSLVEGPALGPELLEGWQANLTRVVAAARQVFPQVRGGGGTEAGMCATRC